MGPIFQVRLRAFEIIEPALETCSVLLLVAKTNLAVYHIER
jgi:hypothetical protein